jgi:hypothetical protein
MAKKKEMDNLAKDAARALAADMSYGKWKALHPNTKDIEEEPVLPHEWRICIRCGKEFKPRKGVRQLYCEANCQQEAATERRKESRRAWYRAYRERKRAEQKGA